MGRKKFEKDEDLLVGLVGVYDRNKKENANNTKPSYNIWLDLFLIIITCGLWIFRVLYRNRKAIAK